MQRSPVLPIGVVFLVRTAALVLLLVLTTANPATAQERTDYRSLHDGLQIVFPGEPTVTETIWKSVFDYMLPARVYSADRGRERYSLAVVDYSRIEQQGIDRVKT